jgi:hypothetical protein
MTRAAFGSNSHTSSPGRLERIGFNSPRISTGASGFISKVSSWLGEP